MRIDKGEAIALRQVLKGHGFQQGRLARPGLANDVDVREAILPFDAEGALIVSEINAAETHDVVWRHPPTIRAAPSLARHGNLPIRQVLATRAVPRLARSYPQSRTVVRSRAPAPQCEGVPVAGRSGISRLLIIS